jgi:hypothetical protein
VSRSQNISSVVKPREKAAISFFSLWLWVEVLFLVQCDFWQENLFSRVTRSQCMYTYVQHTAAPTFFSLLAPLTAGRKSA